jgi:PRTRC genetic system ThiF family protein
MLLTAPLILTLAPRYVLQLGDTHTVQLTLVGCGGTGSFLAMHLARLAWHCRQRGQELHLTFIDPDTVEERNLGRQNFVPAELGAHKAESLAVRYSLAFGLDIRFYNQSFELHWEYIPGQLNVLIGCVDNARARRVIAEDCDWAKGWTWWLDCGNHDHSGQVLLGNRDIPTPSINPLGFCDGLPLPSVQHPELLDDPPAAIIRCAEATAADLQSLMVNQAAAGWAASYLYRMIVSQDLDTYTTYFDLTSGGARSLAIGGQPECPVITPTIRRIGTTSGRAFSSGLETAVNSAAQSMVVPIRSRPAWWF